MNETKTDYKVQSILFNKDKISLEEAIDWVASHKDRIRKIDETETQYRFRQLEPSYLARLGYTEYRTKVLNDTVALLIAYKN
jgi:hypothetical protein